jgi:hypothetical protein
VKSITYLEISFGSPSAIDKAEVTGMSLRNKVVVFTLGALAAIAGLGLVLTNLQNASIALASAVWGS